MALNAGRARCHTSMLLADASTIAAVLPTTITILMCCRGMPVPTRSAKRTLNADCAPGMLTLRNSGGAATLASWKRGSIHSRSRVRRNVSSMLPRNERNG